MKRQSSVTFYGPSCSPALFSHFKKDTGKTGTCPEKRSKIKRVVQRTVIGRRLNGQSICSLEKGGCRGRESCPHFLEIRSKKTEEETEARRGQFVLVAPQGKN